MATMVLSSFGAAVAGPFGGALGALVGSGLDRGLLGSQRSGPKHGDFAVQSSSFGKPIPQIYGRMRVAGTVIWATKPREDPQPSGMAATTEVQRAPSYSVSFAIALSSRRVGRIRRIWADGRLLRTDTGELKLPLTFRFYDGGQDQAVDPLIASAEALGNTPAYRGIAVVVFEDFPLAAFGNRIPSLTFEVEADDVPIRVGAVLEQVSENVISDGGAGDLLVDGYAAYGASMREAVDPFIEAYGIEFVDQMGKLTCCSEPQGAMLDEHELGAQVEPDGVRVNKAYRSERELPKSLLLSHYDPALEYQTGLRQAIAGGGSRAMTIDLPAVITAGVARRLADDRLSREWRSREQLRVTLPLHRIALQPGDEVQLPHSSDKLRVVECQLEDYSVHLDLEPADTRQAFVLAAASEAPSKKVEAPVRPLESVLFEASLSDQGDNIVVYLATSGGSKLHNTGPIEFNLGGERLFVMPPWREAIMGKSLTSPDPGSSALIDRASSVEIQLSNPQHWLESRDDRSLANGANLALLGDELIQFGDAKYIAPGRFRLSRLLRGRKATEWAMPRHKTGERFVLIEPQTLTAIKLPAAALHGELVSDEELTSKYIIVGENLRSPSPVQPRAKRSVDGLTLTWISRTRTDWDWLSEVDLSHEHDNLPYRVTLTGNDGRVVVTTREPRCHFPWSVLMTLGSNPRAEVESLQLKLPSRPLRMDLDQDILNG